MTTSAKPHIVLIIARGESARNFLYSDTLKILKENARVTLLSVITDEKFQRGADEIIELREYAESPIVRHLREVIHYAHYRWLWTEKVKNKWETLDAQTPPTFAAKTAHAIWKAFIYLLANRPTLTFLTFLENQLSLLLKPTNDFNELFERLKPDLVFNSSHIHAPRGELPVRIARSMGIRAATFIFSWDNLSSRGRILPRYDHYLVWHRGMRDQLRALYPAIKPGQITITGTPQFDFHFNPRFLLSREALCADLGLDPARPFVLYTTGMAQDFPEEHRHVQTVIEALREIDSPKPQLVVRTYAKGTSPEMENLARQKIPDVVFPPILWDKKWFTPAYEDLFIYSSLLRHCSLGINPASTVSLELLMLDKPVINIGFDPPGSSLPNYYRWKRHIDFDHYQAVAKSGAVMVAYSQHDLREMIKRGLNNPAELHEARQVFITTTFGGALDGQSGMRAGKKLLELAADKLEKENRA
ncbi:MAG: hypothetical protein PHQ36_13555 [Anaerolineales bacterium]|nr:hypothetical protein [Anaerolineales bacterium]